MKTTKKQKKSNLKVSLLLLLLAAVLLISSTYAWFVSNTNVTVSTLQVNVESVQGIQISVDAETWQPAIDKAALASVGTPTSNNPSAINQLPDKMKPVSTIGEVDQTTGTMNMYLGSLVTKTTATDGNSVDYYALTSVKQTDVNGVPTEEGTQPGHYIAFDMFLKYDGAEATKIYARPGSGVTFADAASQAKKLEYATRIAFIKEGWVASTAENAKATAQGKKYTDKDTANCGIYIWEPNYDLHNTAGTTNAKSQYNVTLTETTTDSIPYSGVKAAIAESLNVYYGKPGALEGPKYLTATDYTDCFASVGVNIKTKAAFDTNTELFSINPGITKIRVYMWVEGQDVDCINEASGSNIKFDLKLSTQA